MVCPPKARAPAGTVAGADGRLRNRWKTVSLAFPIYSHSVETEVFVRGVFRPRYYLGTDNVILRGGLYPSYVGAYNQ
jgi:hypothetical protein